MTSSSTRERDIAIVGVAESDEMGTVPNKSSLQHHAEAAYNALEDAGIAKSEVNGLSDRRLLNPRYSRVYGYPARVYRQYLGGRFVFCYTRCPRPPPPSAPATATLF